MFISDIAGKNRQLTRFRVPALFTAAFMAVSLLFAQSPSLAADQAQSGWHISKTSGDVRYRLSDNPGTDADGTSTRLSGELSQGLDILDARESGSDNLSTTNGRSDFTKGTLQGSRQQTLGAGFSILGAFTGQYAASSLLSSEQFAFGGSQFGRAYDPSEITGDHGIASKLELQYTVPIQNEILKQTQLYTYFDRGDVWTRTPDAGEKHHESGAAAGGGVRYSLGGGINGYLELAKPLTRPIGERDAESGNNLRIFFQLSASL